MKHGEIITEGSYRGCRHCETHGQHGALYPCSEYPQAVLDEIADGSNRYVNSLLDPAWRKEQIDKGMPPVVLAAFMAMAGIE